jgi:glyceraldehyde 3-phosphate dehydrogenase
MKQQVGISGTGRIGRLLIRKAFTTGIPGAQVRAINSTSPIGTVAHLLKYDTVHGQWDADIRVEKDMLAINGQPVAFVSERDPALLPWGEYGIDIAIDATGKFNDRAGAARHLAAGAGRVVVTAPGQDLDLTVVMGVNEASYDPDKHKLLSAASCTTNCLAPVLHILDRAFGVESGWVTTVHAYTNDQNHLDNPHKDLRRARACTQSIVPTSTGVGKALSGVLPHLAPVIRGVSLRVPTQDVSLVDLTVELRRPVTKEEVRQAFKTAAQGALAAYVEYNELPLVSSDYVGNDKSAVIDGLSLMVSGRQAKVLAWYDNEWAYACRVLDFVAYVAQQIETRVNEPWRKTWV